MNEFVRKNISVNIMGSEYPVRELSLAQKIKVLNPVGEFLRDIAKNAFFRKDDKGSISFNFIDEISLAELNLDKIIMCCAGALPEILAMSVPDFKDWDTLPETDTREVLKSVMKVNDFKGFITNFISLATMAIL